ncbi:MAG: hypothetical protein Q4E13_05620 [Clostridia bacterium]|nr:hypothetical protein [Clostridia bacterium]
MGGQANNPFEAGKRLIRPLMATDQKCCVEIVLAISVKQTMSLLWNTISRETETFVVLLKNAVLKKLGNQFVNPRVRIIAYGDFYMDECAMWCSPFFEIPGEERKMAEFLWSIEPEGGGEKKSGMEALLCAMYSPWSRRTGDRRHIIALITDSGAYIPEEPLRGIDCEYEERLETYLPREYVPMPETLEEMRQL